MANENIVYRVVNKKSSVNGKLPTAEQLLYGEIAINYAVSSETISIKNSNDEIITFPSSRVTNRIEGELTDIQSAQTILEADIEDMKSDISDIDLVSARAFNNLNDRLDTIISDVNDSIQELSGSVVDTEEVVSAALNDLNSRVTNVISSLTDRIVSLENEIITLKETITNLGG